MSFAIATQRTLLALACGLLVAGAGHAGVSNRQVDLGLVSAAQRAAPSTDRLIVGYRDASVPDAADARVLRARSVDATAMSSRLSVVNSALALRGVQARVLRQMGTGAHVLQLDKPLSHGELRRVAAEMKAADPNIAYAEPDRKMYPMMVPNDTSYGSQWDLYETTGGIRAPAARTTWRRSRNCGVAAV